MKIAIPIAHYHEGNTGEYMGKALSALGHTVDILNGDSFLNAYAADAYDLFFCIDSGEPLPFHKITRKGAPLSMWFIDFRHNKDRPTRVPNDLAAEQSIRNLGGFVFQAQYEDFLDSQTRCGAQTAWLPVAADSDVWSSEPKLPKQFHVGFIGNIWDGARKRALESLLQAGISVGFPGHGRAWKGAAAQILRASLIGFNISSFYGEPYAYDINMRFFETLSCGIPMITNHVPSISKLLPAPLPCIRYYHSLDEIVPLVTESLKDTAWLASGSLGRDYIVGAATYQHRAQQALDLLKSGSIV